MPRPVVELRPRKLARLEVNPPAVNVRTLENGWQELGSEPGTFQRSNKAVDNRRNDGDQLTL